jgi:hypothetical protein
MDFSDYKKSKWNNLEFYLPTAGANNTLTTWDEIELNLKKLGPGWRLPSFKEIDFIITKSIEYELDVLLDEYWTNENPDREDDALSHRVVHTLSNKERMETRPMYYYYENGPDDYDTEPSTANAAFVRDL